MTDPVPALRLPAFALVLEMNDEELAQSLQLTYQNIVGIINITFRACYAYCISIARFRKSGGFV